jgi:RNA polymerase sigma-70 factor (ECF subfamily)
MDNRDLAEIVSAARKGSELAYQEMVSRFGSKLLGYFYRNIGRMSEAEDLVQELFLRVVKGLKKYKEKERFEVWIFQMARHLLIDYWRKKKVLLSSDMPMNEEEDIETIEMMLETKDESPHDRMVKKEMLDDLQGALERLPAEQREVILMRYFSGLSFEEISKMNNRPIGTILARAHRATVKLKELLSVGRSDGYGTYGT